MNVFLRKYRTWLFPGTFLLILAGIVLVWVGLTRPVRIIKNGQEKIIQTASLSISGVLRSGGIMPQEGDRVMTDPGESIWELNTIQVETVQEILIKTPFDEIAMTTTEKIPANILKSAGLTIFPLDRVLINGTEVNPQAPVEIGGPFLLQYVPAIRFTLAVDGKEEILYTNEPTIGAALEEASIKVSPEDWLSQPLSTPMDDIEELVIRRAQPISIVIDGKTVSGLTSAVTVGDALEDIGKPLQNLDYSIPSADSPLPQDGQIEIVRVNEELMIMTDEVPYENEWVEDPNALLDTISIVEPGQTGIYATRERVRYENGQEIWRNPEGSWQASQVQDGILGYGTRVEIRTEVVDGVEIEYWRKITVYATAYSPCKSGVDQCLYGTATGIMPVQKGVVAVTPRWISVPNGYGMWGQSVYIPGYGRGVIADTGGGIPGTPWIDLAYSDENYQSWNRWTTMYFLTPVPGWFPAIIAP